MKYPTVGKRLVLVNWIDSGRTAGWQTFGDVNNDPIPCVTIGWVVGENKNGLTLCGTFGFTSVGEIGQTCDMMTIPKKAIVRLTTLQYPTRKP